MRKIKNLPLLIMLGTLALTSVGFSVYISDGQASSGFETTIDVGATINYSEACSFDTTKGDNNSGITTLKVCKDGFVENNYCVSSQEMRFYIKIQADYFREHFAEDSLNGMKISLGLGCKNYDTNLSPDLFTSSLKCDAKYYLGNFPSNESSMISINSNTLSIGENKNSTITFSPAGFGGVFSSTSSYSVVCLLVIYTFAFNVSYTFEENIYNRIISNPTNSSLLFKMDFVL